MRWRQGTRSGNIEDRRSLRGPGGAAGGVGLIGLIAIIIIGMAFGMDPMELLSSTDFSTGFTEYQSQLTEEEQNQLADHVSLVLGSTELVWTDIFRNEHRDTYTKPKLVLFTGRVDSACGLASSATGPFYCPADQKVYLDLDFFHELQQRFGAPGDFAQAYVIAHEIGHHVQNLDGTLQQVTRKQSRVSETEANKYSIALELQADCYSGVWANQAAKQDLILDKEDIIEGLNAASAIGDDRLQQEAQGYVVPDSFTHGTSAQRVSWFRKGMESGDIDACDCLNQIDNL
ncbi:MAG: flagellar biosynthesis protein FlgM [Methanomicrobiales archaeon]|nr:flagellar biosynthesis protein FlgM [Methanomicrobiales archaeon]